MPQPQTLRWLVLAHQLPANPSNLRVRVWRRLHELGAVVLRNSLYVLPASDESRENFSWIREEIVGSGGQVSVLEASAVDRYTDAELMQQFRKARTADYEALAADIRKVGERFVVKPRSAALARRNRALRLLRDRFTAVQARDFFDAAGRMVVEQAFKEVEATDGGVTRSRLATKLDPRAYRRRTWITRPRPGIDRMASAWLIRRFVDAQARFSFLGPGETMSATDVEFDMPDVEFGHHGAHCTFETLMHRFGVTDRGVVAMSRIVHDLDLKEHKYAMPEAAAVGRLVDGLRATYPDDQELLKQGMVVIEALYRSFAGERRGRPARQTKR
jgi:hypothetical protein